MNRNLYVFCFFLIVIIRLGMSILYGFAFVIDVLGLDLTWWIIKLLFGGLHFLKSDGL